MKRIFSFIVLFLFVFSAIGCNKTTTDTFQTTTPNTETINEYISYDIDNDIDTSLNMYRFDADFIEPNYSPLTGNITFTLEINDANYNNSTYFVVTRETDSPDFDFLQAFTIDASFVTRYHSIDYTPGKEIIVAKIEGEVYDDHVYLEPVASLIVTDSMEDSRKTITAYNLIENNVEDIEFDQTPYLDCTITATDPERLVSSIKAIVYYSAYDLILDTKVIEVTEDMYDGDDISVNHITFDNLPPEMTFNVIYYFSGNDSVEDFDEVQMGIKRMTTSSYVGGSGIRNAYPGFWGFVNYLEINADNTRVYLHYVNSNVISFNDEYLTASLNVYDDEGVNVKSYPLSDNLTYLDISNQYLGDSYYLAIECDQTDDILSINNINYGLRGLGFLSATYSDQNVRISYQEPLVEVISIYLTITEYGGDSSVIEITVNDLNEGYNDFAYPDGPDGYFQDYDVYIEVTFIGFDGEETYITGYSNR